MGVMSKIGEAFKKLGGAAKSVGGAAPKTPAAPGAAPSTLTAAPAAAPAEADPTSLTKPKEEPDDDTKLDKDNKAEPTDKQSSGNSEGSAESKAADDFYKMLMKATAAITKIAMDYKNWGKNAKIGAGMLAKTVAAPVTLPLEAAKGIKEAGKATVAAAKELGVDIADAKQKVGNSAVGQAVGKVGSKVSDGMRSVGEKLSRQKEGPDELEPGGKSMLPGKEKKENERNSVSNPAPESKRDLKVDPSAPDARKRSSTAPPRPGDPPKPGK